VVWETLDEAKVEALGCTRCRLAATRTQVVWLDGNPDSDLMFVGEAPGMNEDKIGRPFVGAAGKLLDQLLDSIGLDRGKCVICNVIKCRPPANRNPEADEIATCSPYLKAQIEFIKPTVIVTLGNFATRFILERQISITRARGQIFRAFGAKVIPTFHPAAALHSGGVTSPQFALLRSDFKLVSSELAKGKRPPAPPPVAVAPAPVPVPVVEALVQQESLF
jgi:uracil-DNA glycosylase family 4